MKTFTLLIFIVFLLGCHTAQQESTYKVPRDKEITEIVEIILSQDSSFVSDSSLNHFAITKLKKLRIDFTKKNSDIPPPPPGPEEIYLKDLFKLEVDNRPVFSKEDYNYILFQHDSFPEFKFDRYFNAKYAIVPDNNSSEKAVNIFSIPIFNSDNSSAYVQSSQYFSKKWLSTSYFILEKQHGKWNIIKSEFISTH